jgi:hypothetical protein
VRCALRLVGLPLRQSLLPSDRKVPFAAHLAMYGTVQQTFSRTCQTWIRGVKPASLSESCCIVPVSVMPLSLCSHLMFGGGVHRESGCRSACVTLRRDKDHAVDVPLWRHVLFVWYKWHMSPRRCINRFLGEVLQHG